MAADVLVRPAGAADVARLVELHAALLADQRTKGFAEPPLPGFDGPAYFARRLANPAMSTFVAEQLGSVVGYVDCTATWLVPPSRLQRVELILRRVVGRRQPASGGRRREGYLNNIYVEPGARRAGVARALVARVNETLVARGAEVVFTHTLWANDESRAMFEASGYAPARVVLEYRPRGG